jgi:hypothetical protein
MLLADYNQSGQRWPEGLSICAASWTGFRPTSFTSMRSRGCTDWSLPKFQTRAERPSALAGMKSLLREKGSIRADEVTIQAVRDKGLDPENRKLGADLTRRILVSLHDLMKAAAIQKVGHGRGVRWTLIDAHNQDLRLAVSQLSVTKSK